MSNWKVSEKGEPSDKWELSVIDMDAEDAAQLARSYAWQGPHKIIVWSSAGSADYKALPALALLLRQSAHDYATELNTAAQRTGQTDGAALDMYSLRIKLNRVLAEGVYFKGEVIPADLPVNSDTLQEFWDSVRGVGNSVLDSLDVVDLMLAIEEEFNVPIREKEIAAVIQDPKYADVEDVLRWLATKP
jgi:acyl carrier protein